MNEQTTRATSTDRSAGYAYPFTGLVLALGNAAELTLGGDSGSSEDKRYVYA
ncbi:albusnodin family lasso peptide [Pseudonocardiaceae bacterium YIM PH 21723]|nr:albusnodin family lasso peptide [Pseudonocardiaceae bacterium YIM PH 21723]